MNMARHWLLGRLIGPYVDGELPPRERQAVAAHLRECWRCSGDADAARLIKRSLREAPQRAPASLAEARLRHYAGRLTGPP